MDISICFSKLFIIAATNRFHYSYNTQITCCSATLTVFLQETGQSSTVNTQMMNPHLGLAFGCCVAPAVAVVCELTSSSVNK